MSDLGNRRVMGENIKKFMKLKGVSRKELAGAISVPYSTLSDWINANAYPRIDKIEMMANYFKIEKADLVEGNSPTSSFKDNVKPIAMSSTFSIPVYGSVPAGVPIEAIEDIVETIDIRSDWKQRGEYIGLKVVGSSMYPKYLEGDTIVIRLQEDCENRQDAVVYVNGFDATLKTVLKNEDGSITLKPINPEFQEHRYGKGYEEDPVKVLGIVKELRRKI